MPLNNYGLVMTDESGHRLWRGGQPDSDGMFDLDILGMTAIIKLDGEKPEPSLPHRGYIVLHRPLAELYRANETDAVIKICREINGQLSFGHTYVHCAHGRDRTGLVCAAYLLMYRNARLDTVNDCNSVFGSCGFFKLFDLPDQEVLKKVIIARDMNRDFSGILSRVEE